MINENEFVKKKMYRDYGKIGRLDFLKIIYWMIWS